MYKNKNGDSNNIAGKNVRRIRLSKTPKMSQNDLAIQLQNYGHDIHKNTIQELESGKRFVTDIELKALSEVLNTSVDELLYEESEYSMKNKKDSLLIAQKD